MDEASCRGLVFKYCLSLLDHIFAAWFTHRGGESFSPSHQPLLNTWSESLSISVKGLDGGAQIMCLFFPRHPAPIFSSKCIYLPRRVLIDRKLECSEWCIWRRASPRRAVMLLLDLPRLNPQQPCFCLNSRISSETPPPPTTNCFLGSLIFQGEKCLW